MTTKRQISLRHVYSRGRAKSRRKLKRKQTKVEHIHLTVGLLFWDIELIELPRLPQQITEKGEYLKVAKG